MIITGVETFPLRIPFKPGSRSAASAWGPAGLHERDLAVVRAGREEAGPEVALMIDVNTAWTVNQARAMAAELRDVAPKWLEEPVWPPENYDGLAQVRWARRTR